MHPQRTKTTTHTHDRQHHQEPNTRRRLNETPDSNLSLRHCKMYDTMVGSMSVTIDDTNDTAQIMIEGYTPVGTPKTRWHTWRR